MAGESLAKCIDNPRRLSSKAKGRMGEDATVRVGRSRHSDVLRALDETNLVRGSHEVPSISRGRVAAERIGGRLGEGAAPRT